MNLEFSRYSHLEALSQPEHIAALKGIRRGIERESLRVDGDARLVTTSHPVSLGSALTHEQITTDFAEAMLELITPAGTDAEETLEVLTNIHRQVYRHLRNRNLLFRCRLYTTGNGITSMDYRDFWGEIGNYPGRFWPDDGSICIIVCNCRRLTSKKPHFRHFQHTPFLLQRPVLSGFTGIPG
ncbi:hypothetical protein FY034_18280 (plasmid) [Trichlorobacter lovleyi]|nr:hypothetical protein FY034_18280 [Trichlorobacter lovleyi]